MSDLGTELVQRNFHRALPESGAEPLTLLGDAVNCYIGQGQAGG